MRPCDAAIHSPLSVRTWGTVEVAKDHAAALGYVVAYSAALESIQRDFIPQLLRLTFPVGHAVTAELSGLQRLALIRTLLDCLQHQEWLDEWDELAGAMRDLQSRRNDAVHAEWYNHKGTFFAKRQKARVKLQITRLEVSADELLKLSEQIVDVTDKFLLFGHRLLFQANPPVWSILQNLRDIPEPPPTPSLSRKARAQAEGRVRKKAQREADRAASRKPLREPNAS